MNLTELAWAAGFFDGEGSSFRAAPHHGKAGSLTVCVMQVEREPLMRLRAAIGLGNVTGPYERGRSRPISTWKVTGFEKAQAAVAMMWRYLSTPKRRQYMVAVSTYKRLWTPRVTRTDDEKRLAARERSRRYMRKVRERRRRLTEAVQIGA